MNGDSLPEADHILRYVGRGKVQELDGKIIYIAEAFIGQPNNPQPSVNWLECFSEPVSNQVAEVRRLRRVRYGATGLLARLNVGHAKRSALECLATFDGGEINIVEAALDASPPDYLADPSHAEIIGVPIQIGQPLEPLAQAVGDAIARCVIDSFPAIADE